MSRKAKKSTTKIGWDTASGQFIPVGEAIKRPRTTVIETLPRPKK